MLPAQAGFLIVVHHPGVARDCSDSDIKKAYRRESLKHHPDKVSFAPGLCTARWLLTATARQGGDEEKFKLVAEAHTVLSNPQTRQRYDLGEDDEPMGMGGGMGGMDFADIFAQFHTQQGGFRGGGFGGGGFGGGGFGGGAYGRSSHGGGFYTQGFGF